MLTTLKGIHTYDISDPATPMLLSSVVTPTRTHTVSCAKRECPFAYSDGRVGGAISIVDLRDPAAPKVATTYKSVVPSGHDQDVDDAGILWHTGAQGTRILDVRGPADIKQVGSFFTGAMETWGAHRVPARWAKGQTLVYTADAVRGVDVLRVALPQTPPARTEAVRAPVLRSWIAAGRDVRRALSARRSDEWGFLCPLAPVSLR